MSVPSDCGFDVVIPAHNAAETIGQQLEAIRRNDQPRLREVVVVDSCSVDATAELALSLNSTWGKIRVVHASEPGANAARNAGIAAGLSDLVLLCDADDIVSDDWAEALVSALAEFDAVRGRYSLGLLNDSETIAARGSLSSTQAPDPEAVIDGLGGNCGFRRSVWKELGGLSERHTGSDDVEFFWRAALAGFRTAYVDEAVVHYRLRPGLDSLFRQQRAWAANRALLHKEFGRHGFIRRRRIGAAVKQWGWLIAHLHFARSNDPAERGRWVRASATSVGNLEGSLRHRVWYP